MFNYLHKYRSLQWGNNQFGSSKDTYERGFKKTFRKIDYHRLTHGYGVIRDSSVQLRRVLNSVDTPMMASFVILPGPSTENGQPIYYLAFVQCDSEDLVRDVYLVGESGTFCFQQPPRNLQPSGWQYTIKPPVPKYEYPGNLVMQITRARGDNRELAVSPEPEPLMKQQQVWAFPDASDLAPCCLIDCANLIIFLGNDGYELCCYVCALDLYEKEKTHGLFSNMTESQTKSVNNLLSNLSPSQLGAFEHIKQTKHDIVFVKGPPGTGKTTFIITFLQILCHLNHSWIACAPSNSATDHLATVLQQKCPQLGAIRFHSYDNEARAIRRQERDLTRREETEDNAADKVDDKSNEKAAVEAEKTYSQDALAERFFHAYMAELQQKDTEWKRKPGRPNFKDMGLNIRALQNARVVEHNIQCFAPTGHDPHAEFRECLKNQDFARGKTDEEITRYQWLEDQLMIDTLRKSKGVITTLSKTGDNKLNKAKKPVVAVIDEACQSTELETLLVWAHNTETLLLLVFLGDPKQLRGTVKSYNQNTSDNLVNPFANQMIISFFERLWIRNFDTYMFTEQYRLAEGLEEVFNHLFYNGKITNADCTKIENRPGAQNAIEYIQKTYRLHDDIPHVCINVVDGVCLRGASKSRFNPQNIAATTHAINLMLDANLWTQDEISVITPYREQAALYRKVFRSEGWYRLQVYTADSVQGREDKCTIFDIVLAFARVGGWGFVKEGLRLNVAISRSQDHFVLVCDLAALDPSERHRVQLDQLDPEEREDRKRAEREMGKYIQGLFQYFNEKGMVYQQYAETLPEISLVDMTAVKEFRQKNARRNCQQIGHRSDKCPNPHVESIICHNCGQSGHRQSQCPTKTFNQTCRHCLEKDMEKRSAPNSNVRTAGEKAIR